MADDNGVTKEFLESSLKQPIERFQVKPGSSLGDGYTCALLSVDVWAKDKDEPESIVIKCYPSNSSRQEMLDRGSFVAELEAYKTMIPELVKFQEEFGVENVIQPPFARFIHGQFFPPSERKNLPAPFKVIDNNIILPDLRQNSNGGFRLRDRFQGFDRDHYNLVIEAQAKLHALSWAYKCKTGVESLQAKFPGLKSPTEQIFNMYQPFMDANYGMCAQMLKDHPEELKAIEHLKSIRNSMNGLYWNFEYGQTALGHTKDNILKKPGAAVENEEPWNVILHGDAHSNNMMFRYDEKTGRPVEVLFVDLQIMSEGDPFLDICYTLYVSVAPNVRPKHLESFLHTYYDTFTRVCDQLRAPYLPGWCWEEFNRRFHRAKPLGPNMCIVLLPLLLKNVDELSNLDEGADTEEKKRDASNLFERLSKSKKENPVLKNRLLAPLRELIEDEVL